MERYDESYQLEAEESERTGYDEPYVFTLYCQSEDLFQACLFL